MSLQNIKHQYWNILNAIERKRHPRETVLSPHNWQDAIKRFAPAHQPTVFIDGGAHDGAFARDFSARYRDIQIHAFEPNTELARALVDNLPEHTSTINHTALGATTGHTHFHIGASPMTSSVLASNSNGKSFYHDVIVPRETLMVPVTTLDDYAQKHNLNHIHILKLDLQGFELEALKGAKQLLTNKKISCIFTEINFMPFYEGSALFSDLDNFLRNLGYRLHNFYNLATRNSNNQLTGGDALFIPDAAQQACTNAA